MLTPPPPAPSPNDPDNFNAAADSRVAWEDINTAEMNVLQADVTAKQATASTAAATATTQAQLAAASAAAAQSSANALPFSAATAYTQGQSAISLLDQQTYRRKTAGTSSTDPKNDSSNWTRISGVPLTPTSSTTVAGSSDFIASSSLPGLLGLQFTAPGCSLWLPNATTMVVGGVLYEISNTGNYPSGIRDSTGTLLAVLEPGGSATVDLRINSPSSGTWSIHGEGFSGGLITLDRTFSTSFNRAFLPFVSLSSKLSLHFVGSTSGFAAYLVDYTAPATSQAAITTPVTVTTLANVFPLAAFAISSTQAIVFYGVTTDVYSVILTVSGSSPSFALTVGTPTAPITSYGTSLTNANYGETFYGPPKIVALASALYLVITGDGLPNSVVIRGVALSVSGSTIQVGTETALHSASGAGYSCEPQVYPTSGTSAVVVFGYNSNATSGPTDCTLRAVGVVANASTLALSASAPATMGVSGVNLSPQAVAQLAPTKLVVAAHLFSPQAGVASLLQANGLAVSWTSPQSLSVLPVGVSLGVPLSGLGWSASLQPTPNRYARRATALSTTQVVVWVATTNGSAGIIITESSGALTIGSPTLGIAGSADSSSYNSEDVGAVIAAQATSLLSVVNRGAAGAGQTIELLGAGILGAAIAPGPRGRLPCTSSGYYAAQTGSIQMGDGRVVVLTNKMPELQLVKVGGAGLPQARSSIRLPSMAISALSRPPVDSSRIVLAGVDFGGAPRVINVEIVA